MATFFISGLMCRSQKVIYIAFTWFQVSLCLVRAQEPALKSTAAAEQFLSSRGEVIIRFAKPAHVSLDEITAFLSIDDFRNDTVIAYANDPGFRQFLALNLPFEVLSPPSLRTEIFNPDRYGLVNWWDKYPAYNEYVALMEGFAADYPDNCRLTEFGTSLNGRKLLAMKISDNPGVRENEPVVFYSSTMHGDETIGYVLMLRLIDYLLVNYDTDLAVKRLVDKLEIWINPLANPDGTYFLSDASVEGATRLNGNQVDLNRNFPDIRYANWESTMRQPETTALMNLLKDIQPALSANFHEGAEVVNYPWDTWSRLHADDLWYRKISRAYADTAQFYGQPGYMTYLDNGITNGYAWYSLYGGRQDYTTCILHGREVTIELSNDKMPSESSLNDYWNYNKKSLLQYIGQALTGVAGDVLDSVTAQPVVAKIMIENHDIDSSFVFSEASLGSFYRLTDAGNYIFLITAPGYVAKRLQVCVTEGELTPLVVKLAPVIIVNHTTGIESLPLPVFYPNPFLNRLFIYIGDPGYDMVLEFIDLSGRKVKHMKQLVPAAGIQEIEVTGLESGVYVVNLLYRNQSLKQVVLRNDCNQIQ